ncbi:MAG: agmatine deiminase family protein [Planctomycetaceae bacterium]|nr:agmatine deiminase family protein [Planctomycetaceae bacterium]
MSRKTFLKALAGAATLGGFARSVQAAPLRLRMPAEWEPHEATWLSWPHNRATWPDAFEGIPETFVEIVRHLAGSELIRINVADAEMEAEVQDLLQMRAVPRDQVRFHHHPTNDCWVRDHGPIYVVRDRDGVRERAVVDWGYNAWGGKYPPFDRDVEIPRRIAAESEEFRFDPHMILEGGSIEVDGCGLLITTESCLLNPNRNPRLSRTEIEQRLRDYLAVRKVLWLGDGIAGDDTDGHIDDMTRLVGPGRVVTAVEEDPLDENYEPLQENLQRLQSMTDADGNPLEIIQIPMPGPVFHEEHRLPASYSNFLIANSVVLVPVFSHPHDEVALEKLQLVFPDRRVIGVECTKMVWGLGAIHCASQQQPKGEGIASV